MNMKHLVILFICGLLLLILIAGVLANTVETQLTWSVVAGGGGTVQSNDRQIQQTIGQTITGSIHGNAYELGSGYWPGIVRVVPPPREKRVFLPFVRSPF